MTIMPFTNRQILILYELLHSNNLTAASLSLSLGVSVRTIKSEISVLKPYLREYNIVLESIPGSGYKLTSDTNDIILESLQGSQIIKRIHRFSRSNSERVSHILVKLLSNNNYMKMDDLVEEMYLGRGSIQNDLKDVRNLLSKYDLVVQSKPAYGMKIVGKEHNIRSAISEYIFHNELSLDTHDNTRYGENKAYIQKIETVLRDNLKAYRLSDFTLYNIAIHIYIMYQRKESGHDIDAKDCSVDQDIVTIITDVFKKLELNDFSIDEVKYISYHIDNKQIIDEAVSHSDFDVLVDTILIEVMNNFGLDLRTSITFRKQLGMHIKQMVKRLNNDMFVRNPLVYRNLRDYVFASKMTISASKMIENTFDIYIPIDEFGYLLLYFQSALDSVDTKQTLLINFQTGGARSEAQVYYHRLRKTFENKYTQIRMNDDSSHSDINVSFRDTVSADTISIQNNQFLNQIQSEILRIRSQSINLERYINEDTIQTGIKGTTKKAVLASLEARMETIELLKEDYAKRADFVSLEIGNQVLHLQDYGKKIKKSVFLIAILDRAIIWDKTVVRVLVLIKTKRDGDHDLHTLCTMFSNWANQSSAVAKLIENPSLSVLKTSLDLLP